MISQALLLVSWGAGNFPQFMLLPYLYLSGVLFCSSTKSRCPKTMQYFNVLSLLNLIPSIIFGNYFDYLSLNVSILCSERNCHVAEQQSSFANKPKKWIAVKVHLLYLLILSPYLTILHLLITKSWHSIKSKRFLWIWLLL